jgi:hypothetical protein
MKLKHLMLFGLFGLLLTACSTAPKVTLNSVEFVDSINTSGGVQVNFTGMEIIQLKLDFKFDPAIAAGLDPASDDYRSELYPILVAGAEFYYGNDYQDPQYGFWPTEAGSNYADELTLFYLVPENHDPDLIRFVYDGSVLGEGANGIDTILEPK